MTAADQYNALAADCQARSQREQIPAYRREWEFLARAYRRLAQQAERETDKTDHIALHKASALKHAD